MICETVGARHHQVSRELPGVLCLLAACTYEACINGTAFSLSIGLHDAIVSYDFVRRLQGMSRNFNMLLAAVMVGSVGASVHLTLSVSLVSDLLPPQHVRYISSLHFCSLESPSTLPMQATSNDNCMP